MSEGALVLDASAVLALLNEEPGAGQVQAHIGQSVLSTVNAAEVAGKLSDYGMVQTQIEKTLAVGFDIVPFTREEIGFMRAIRRGTSKLGLSLGDRCCMATGMNLDLPVLTADRAWAGVKIRGLRIAVLEERR